MNENYWLKRSFYNKIFDLEKKLIITSKIKDKKKKIKDIIYIRNQAKTLLSEYKKSKINDQFLLKNISKKINSIIFRIEKESAKK